MAAEARDVAGSTLVVEYGAVENSIELVRVKQSDEDVVVAARFEDRSGRRRRAVMGLRVVDGAWRQTGGFGGAEPSTDDDASWHSGGWTHSSGRRTIRGFWVAEPSAVSLRVTDNAGRAHEDTIEDGISLLLWDGALDLHTGRVELLDPVGNVIKAGPVWPAPSRTER